MDLDALLAVPDKQISMEHINSEVYKKVVSSGHNYEELLNGSLCILCCGNLKLDPDITGYAVLTAKSITVEKGKIYLNHAINFVAHKSSACDGLIIEKDGVQIFYVPFSQMFHLSAGSGINIQFPDNVLVNFGDIGVV